MSAVEVARPLRKDAAENRERLLRAAAVVFAEQGLDASVEEVARAAGVGMGTLYRRFPTKEALIAELVGQLQQEFIDDARRAAQLPDGLGLETFLHDAARRQATHRGCLPRLWNSASTTAAAEEIRRLIAELAADARAHGRVRPEVTTADIVVVFWAMRGVIESTLSVAPDAWQRHLAVVVAGLRPATDELPGRPLTETQLGDIRASSHSVHRGASGSEPLS
jgi:AcrR family transcriptional regulator